MFTEWCSNEIKLQLETGTKLDGIEAKLTLTTWIIEFYNKRHLMRESQSYRMVGKVPVLKMP